MFLHKMQLFDLGKDHSWPPWCREKRQIGPWPARRALLVNSKDLFFLNYIDLFWSPSRKEIIAYHSYISIIDEEELATLRRFTMSSTFWWSLSNIVGGLSARVYDILRPDRPKNDAPWPWPIEFDDLAQHEGANKRNLWKVFYTWHNKRITAQH